jgi:glycosyltransferase involved in cell wall biosynthesis
MNHTGWLVNDKLTAIPNTRTFWHDLLDYIPGLKDKTGGNTPFKMLVQHIEDCARHEGLPDYIIRNASYFNRIPLLVPTISVLQDIGRARIDVCNASTVVVCNSSYTKSHYQNVIHAPIEIIPLGIDFDFFHSSNACNEKYGILDNSILFVGSSLSHPKGFDTIRKLIETTSYNFCLVMKDNFEMNHPRVRVFNKVSQNAMREIMNSCRLLVCTSVVETQHLAGLEAAACGLPLVVTNVGAYYDLQDGDWGCKVVDDNFISCIEYVMQNTSIFSPRTFFLNRGFDKPTCMQKWNTLIQRTIQR